MCGILFSYGHKTYEYAAQSILEDLKRRGPDYFSIETRTIISEDVLISDCHPSPVGKAHFLTFASSVLSLRGKTVVSQPLKDSASNSLLCWNGEAWRIDGQDVEGNDAEIVFDLLLKAAEIDPKEKPAQSERRLHAVIRTISSICGPYAFLFYNAWQKEIFYGRDALGRRSLLMKWDPFGNLIISSTGSTRDGGNWTEVEADGIYYLDFAMDAGPNFNLYDKIRHFPWAVDNTAPGAYPSLESHFPPLNKYAGNGIHLPLALSSPSVDELCRLLQQSLLIRTVNIPPLHYEKAQLSRIAVLFSGGLDCTVLAGLLHTILPRNQEIDLLNVAFENPRVIKATAAGPSDSRAAADSAFLLCPDRLTSISSHTELLQLFPRRTWRLVSINVPYAELQAHRSQIISLMHPHNTEMDFSIACALYFAARGSGVITEAKSGLTIPYATPARILFSGLGADELFGGYTRHATAFTRGGFRAFAEELELDFKRLGKRNLGRDDRVISHWGREVRYPYLDESLVSWALRVPLWEKCSFGQDDLVTDGKSPRLEAGKRLLRLLAWKLGLKGAATEKKRAIQFGARTAKMIAGNGKGTSTIS